MQRSRRRFALSSNDAPPAKTENIVTPPATSPLTLDDAPVAQTEAERAADTDAIAQLVEVAIAESTAAASPTESLARSDQSRSDFADEIIEKAATRLQIDDEGDALAAAIVRGLEQMEEESGAKAAPACENGIPEETADDDAAALNARMTAELRGEDDFCAE